MQEAMYDVKRCFNVRLAGIVVEGRSGTDEDLSEEFLIERERDAVGRCRVLKVLAVELGDPSGCDEMDRDLLAIDFFMFEEEPDKLLCGRCTER
jgi:hypothetical protein